MLTRIIKKPLFLIPAIMAAAIGLVVSLAWVALKPINQKNGFNRQLIGEIVMTDTKKKVETINGIAGATGYHIYFRTKDPDKLWVTDRHLENGKYITLHVPNDKRIAGAYYCIVDSPAVHILANNLPAVIKADLNGGITSVHRFPTALFTRATVIGPDSYVFRGFDTIEKRAGQIFIKGNPQTGELVRKKDIIDTKSDKVGIVTDGQLVYDKQTHLLIYVAYYRNTFICVDTNLNLVYSGHTIDTTGTYQVEAGQVDEVVTNTSPARVVNTKSRVANGRLYIISKLRADNEETDIFGRNAVIDIYELKDGKYKGSFYVPYYKREKLSDFKVVDNQIIALYKTHLALYSLP